MTLQEGKVAPAGKWKDMQEDYINMKLIRPLYKVSGLKMTCKEDKMSSKKKLWRVVSKGTRVKTEITNDSLRVL